MRDRLIELKRQFVENFDCGDCHPEKEKCRKCLTEKETDNLLENGVIVPPCKVGDKVYRISTRSGTKIKYIQETTISRIAIDNEGIWLFCTCNPIAKCVFGKTVFPTREQTEAKLKEGGEG